MDLINSSNSIEPLSPSLVVFLLLDGWGIAQASEANIISLAKTPTFLSLIKEYPVALLEAGEKNINARYLSIGSGYDLSDENIEPRETLTKILSENNLTQIKITETERLAALTHFFNGHHENKLKGEDWNIVSSEASDDSHKLSLVSNKIIRESIKAIKSDKYNFILISMPIIDLVASQGNPREIKKAIEITDKNLKKIVEAVQSKKGVLIISSASGNAENTKSMVTELIDKEITNNPVPVIIVGENFKGRTIGLSEPLNNDLSLLAPAGSLQDLTPTILEIMNLSKPEEMKGESLIDKN
ncbi:MAG: hypothetical protein ACOYL8_00415 [Patescibacteria group bacterium]